MYVREVVNTLVRRWWMSVLGLIATVGLCLLTLTLVPPSYQATANVVLLPPSSSVLPGGNPYLQLGGLGQALDVVTRAMSSQTNVDSVKARTPDASFTVTPDYATSGPILIVIADGPDQRSTFSVLNAVLGQVPSTLRTLQDSLGIQPKSQITSMVITIDKEAATVSKARLRAVIAAAAGGLAASALLISLLDGVLRRKTNKSSSTTGSSIRELPHDGTPGSDSKANDNPIDQRSGRTAEPLTRTVKSVPSLPGGSDGNAGPNLNGRQERPRRLGLNAATSHRVEAVRHPAASPDAKG